MRVTAETKAATRESILQAARRLFAESGFEATTTRDIAHAAGIASGTLFNYFTTKEAIVACMAEEALGSILDDVVREANSAATFEESLFALIAACLRRLKPLRKYLPALLTTSLSPLAEDVDQHGSSLRLEHLEAVAQLARRFGYQELSPVGLQLYWTLYIGVIVFWARDKSPKQEDTLALVDESLNMFVDWLHDDDVPHSPPQN
jgi:AcrR family transcriptional regulator